MISWDTIHRLYHFKDEEINPILISIILEEIEYAIESLQEKRDSVELLSIKEDEHLRSLILKRYLLIRKMREYIHNRNTTGQRKRNDK